MTTQTATTNPLATPTLVIGITAAVLGLLSVAPLVGLLLAGLACIAGLAAVVLGHIALARGKDTRVKAGLILGYIGLAVTVGMLVIRFAAVLS